MGTKQNPEPRTARVVYEMQGNYGINVRVSLIKKNKRYKGDGIKLELANDIEVKKGKYNTIEMKDWEALEIIHALSQVLLIKRKVIDK